MNYKKRKCPLFLVSLVLAICVSLVTASVLAVNYEALVNGGFETAFNYDGTDWQGSGAWVADYEWYRSTTFFHAGSYSFYTGYDSSYEYGYPLNIWQGIHYGDNGVNPHDIAEISIWVLGSDGQFVNSNVIQVLTSGGWIQIADLSNSGSGYSSWTEVSVLGGHGSALDTATGGSNITTVALILYTGSTTYPEMGIAVDDFSVSVADTAYGGGAVVTPTPPSYTGDDLLTSAMNMFAPFVVMAIPAFILGVYMKMGVWGFLLGIDMGIAMAYAFLPVAMKPAVYMIFLVGLINFGMVWKGRG